MYSYGLEYFMIIHIGVEQRDRHMAASIQFHVGNRCYFHINGKRMSGEIASLNIKPGFHSVSATVNALMLG